MPTELSRLLVLFYYFDMKPVSIVGYIQAAMCPTSHVFRGTVVVVSDIVPFNCRSDVILKSTLYCEASLISCERWTDRLINQSSFTNPFIRNPRIEWDLRLSLKWKFRLLYSGLRGCYMCFEGACCKLLRTAVAIAVAFSFKASVITYKNKWTVPHSGRP
jgi:hypothetical protein